MKIGAILIDLSRLIPIVNRVVKDSRFDSRKPASRQLHRAVRSLQWRAQQGDSAQKSRCDSCACKDLASQGDRIDVVRSPPAENRGSLGATCFGGHALPRNRGFMGDTNLLGLHG